MFRVGSWVGGERWPNRGAHPDDWGRPLGGRVLDVEESAAWAHTPEFPVSRPNGADVLNHVTNLRKQGKLDGVVPVMWDFNGHREIRWEIAAHLRAFSDDVKLWHAARALRRDEIENPRRAKGKSIADYLSADSKHLAPA